MYILFKNQTTLTKNACIEAALSANKTHISVLLFLTGFGFIHTGYVYGYVIKDYVFTLCCLGSAIVVFATPFYIYRSHGVKNHKNQLLLSEGKEPKVNITIYEDYLTFNKFIPTINEHKTGYKSEAKNNLNCATAIIIKNTT